MLAIVQQDNKIHEPRAPQRSERSATVTGQTECGHHYVGHRGRIRHRGQLDYPHTAAMGGRPVPGHLPGQGGLTDTAGPDDRDQLPAVDDPRQRHQVVVTAQQAVTGRRDHRSLRRRGGCVEGIALGLPQPFGRFEPDGGQRVVGPSIGVERFGGSATAAQGADQDFPSAFIERKLGQQRLGLRNGGGELTRSQQHVGELFSRTDSELLQGAGLGAHGVKVGQLPESGPVPQCEGGA